MKVALFTCFHPTIGGGAVNLRTLLPGLEGLDVTWFHFGPPQGGPASVSVGDPLMGGSVPRDLIRTSRLWLGGGSRALDAIADRMLALGADRHWVVAMNEGLLLGERLRRKAPQVPLHVSVQDDQEHAVFGRSRRYRWMARLARRPWRRLLATARSVDVTSDGMAAYYARHDGLRSTVVHPVVAPSPPPETELDPRYLTLGHVGAIYAPDELVAALTGLRLAAATRGRRPRLVAVGMLPRYRSLVEEAGLEVIWHDALAEPAAVAALRACDLLYAMYPFGRRFSVFVRTSLPTKLTTYLQVARPILAHTPADSTLAAAVREFGTGVVCADERADGVAGAIGRILTQSFPPERFEHWRQACYGPENAARLRALLLHGRSEA